MTYNVVTLLSSISILYCSWLSITPTYLQLVGDK